MAETTNKKAPVEVEKRDYLAEKDVWVNADWSKVVEAGSPEAAFLMVPAGQALVHDDAIRFGLIKPAKGEVVATPGSSATGSASNSSK